MTFTAFLFYCFSGILLASAAGTVACRQPAHSALSLVLAFVTMAALWVMLGAEFVGLALIVIYVGAVMVFFLFVIMMLDLHEVDKEPRFKLRLAPLVCVGLVMFFELAALILRGATNAATVLPVAKGSNTASLANLLFTEYLLPFEIVAFLLLAAMVAAIALTHRKNAKAKRQNPALQVKVKREQRVKLIHVTEEKLEEPQPQPETTGTTGSQWK